MSVPASSDRATMPARFKGAMVVMVVQVVVNALGGLALISDISNRHRHGQEVSGFGSVAAMVDLLFAAALLLCLLTLRSRRPWVRPAAMALEGLVALSAVISLVGGEYLSVGGLVLAIVTIVLLSNRAD